MTRFYRKQHPYYCGIDLHTRKMYVCVVDQAGQILVRRNLQTRGDHFPNPIALYRRGLVVGVECMFSWYWLADLCEQEGIEFVLDHAMYMLPCRPRTFSSLIGRRPRLLP